MSSPPHTLLLSSRLSGAVLSPAAAAQAPVQAAMRRARVAVGLQLRTGKADGRAFAGGYLSADHVPLFARRALDYVVDRAHDADGDDDGGAGAVVLVVTDHEPTRLQVQQSLRAAAASSSSSSVTVLSIEVPHAGVLLDLPARFDGRTPGWANGRTAECHAPESERGTLRRMRRQAATPCARRAAAAAAAAACWGPRRSSSCWAKLATPS
eukprot:scaffold1564_cov389-Prasinococcus_capsulatus_cf.AAC.25